MLCGMVEYLASDDEQKDILVRAQSWRRVEESAATKWIQSGEKGEFCLGSNKLFIFFLSDRLNLTFYVFSVTRRSRTDVGH